VRVSILAVPRIHLTIPVSEAFLPEPRHIVLIALLKSWMIGPIYPEPNIVPSRIGNSTHIAALGRLMRDPTCKG